MCFEWANRFAEYTEQVWISAWVCGPFQTYMQDGNYKAVSEEWQTSCSMCCLFTPILTEEHLIYLNTHTEDPHLVEVLYEWSVLGEVFMSRNSLPIIRFQATVH